MIRPRYDNITGIRGLSAEEREAYDLELSLGADKQALDTLVACGYSPELFTTIHLGKFSSDQEFMEVIFSDGRTRFPYANLAMDLLDQEFFEVGGHYFMIPQKKRIQPPYAHLANDLFNGVASLRQ